MDQHGTRVTVRIVLRQANQENISATRTDGERRNRSIVGEPQYRFTPQWTPSFHPPPRRGPAPLLVREDLLMTRRIARARNRSSLPVSPTMGKYIQPYTGPLTATTGHIACRNRRLLPQNHSRKKHTRTSTRHIGLPSIDGCRVCPRHTIGTYTNPASSNFNCRGRAARSTNNGLSGIRYSGLNASSEQERANQSPRRVLGPWTMMVRAKKDKGNPTRQEYPNGKRTKERDEGAGIHEGVAGLRQRRMASSW